MDARELTRRRGIALGQRTHRGPNLGFAAGEGITIEQHADGMLHLRLLRDLSQRGALYRRHAIACDGDVHQPITDGRELRELVLVRP